MDQIAAALQQLPEHEQRMIGESLQEAQVKSSMGMYFRTVERCFADCVNDMTTSKMMPKENSCMENCFGRFMKYGQRITVRFTEENARMQEETMREAAGGSK